MYSVASFDAVTTNYVNAEDECERQALGIREENNQDKAQAATLLTSSLQHPSKVMSPQNDVELKDDINKI